MRNMEAVRAVYDGWFEGNLPSALAHLDPAVVWEAIPDAPDAGTYRGHAGVRRYMEDWLGDFEMVSMDFEEVVEAPDRLVLVQRASATGKGSGVETELHYAVAYWLSDQTITQVREFRTKAEALEAAGLTE
jgi:ketosteroid isomerase-like protein